jgi:serine protease AprX
MSQAVVSPRAVRWHLVAALTLAALLATLLPAAAPTLSTLRPASTVAPAAVTTTVDPAVGAAIAEDGTADVIVRATASARGAAADLVRRTGGTVIHDLEIVDGFAATIGAASLDALVRSGVVVAVTLDGPVQLAGRSHSSDGDSVYVETINAKGLYQDGIDGSGVGIAIIDTGVSEVTDLTGRVVGALDLSGEYDDVDRYGHGTFLAGIAAGDGTASGGQHTGVAPGAHIVPVKIAGADGSADISRVLAAFQYVVSFKDEYGIRVVNLSLGTNSQQPYRLSPLNYAVERAWDAGLVVVVSGGNHGELGPGWIPKPADDPLVITVGALDTHGTYNKTDDEIAPFSSIGPSIADGIQKPDIVAPGTSIISTLSPGSTVATSHPDSIVDGEYMRGSGTSFAAAVVSGAAALMLQDHPDWTPDEVKGAILATARPGPVGDPNVDGAGIIDVDAAASLTSPMPANQDVPRSTGLGLMSEDRGDISVDLYVDALIVRLDLGTELTAQNLVFDPVTYTSTEWTNSSWYNTSWYNSSWYNSSWYNSSWYNSSGTTRAGTPY